MKPILRVLIAVVLGAPALFAQAVAPAPVQQFQYFDNNGKPLAGGKVCSYAAGTTTPLVTYGNSAATPNTNPVILDSAGRAGIWLGPVAYKIVLRTAGTTNDCTTGTIIYSVDGVFDPGQKLRTDLAATTTGNGAALVGFKQSGATTARTVQTKLQDIVNAKDFGATGDGVTNDSTAIAAAIAAVASAGGTVQITPGTFILSTATASVPDNVCLVGAGAGGTTLKATGAFPAVTILNAQNACVRDLSIQSVNEGILIKTTSAGHPTQYPLVQNVNLTSVGDTYAAVHVTNTACCVYWANFLNVNIDGGSAAPAVGTRIGYLFDGTTGYNIRPVFTGGRVVNVKYGFDLVSMSSGFVWGTELDGITTGTSAGIGIWAQTGVGFNQFNVRMEGSGSGGSIDKYWQLDAGSTRNWITEIGYAGAPSTATDAGTLNCIIGGDGSGGLANTCLNPQSIGNLTIPSTYTFSMPGTTNGQSAVGGAALTTDQLLGVSAVSTVRAPNSNYGFPQALLADSSGRAMFAASPDISTSGSLGTSMVLVLPTGSGGAPQFTFGANGGHVPAPYVDFNTPLKVAPVTFANLGTCTPGIVRPIIDANVTTFNATITAGGGAGKGLAYCNDSSAWTFH